MKDETFENIMSIKSEDQLLRFNKFEFKNPRKIKFVLFNTTLTQEGKTREFTSALEAFRAWYKSLGKNTKSPFILIATPFPMDQPGQPVYTGLSFDHRDLEVYTPAQITLAYQKLLDRITDLVKSLVEQHPEAF